MAAIPPPYHKSLFLDQLTATEFLHMAAAGAKQLEWTITEAGDTHLRAFTPYSIRSWSEEVIVRVEGQYADLVSRYAGNPMTEEKNRKNVEQLIAATHNCGRQHTAAELAQRYAALQQELAAQQRRHMPKPPQTIGQQLTGVFRILLPSREYFITPLLIYANALVFLLMVLAGVDPVHPAPADLVAWGANLRPAVLAGQWWRLLTCCFLHIGIVHLVMNMYALLYIGLLLEPRLGRWRFLIAYLVSGIAGSIASAWWHQAGISAGASGAIFGMYGVFLALLTTGIIEKAARRVLLISMLVFVGYNLLNRQAGVDHAAHLGGLVAGMLMGYMLMPRLRTRTEG